MDLALVIPVPLTSVVVTRMGQDYRLGDNVVERDKTLNNSPFNPYTPHEPNNHPIRLIFTRFMMRICVIFGS